ncbi:11094_t:CDS:2 [Funneliformis geosporum]|nr:11094_t:CDS:2 [Funneliformis geosporum]
MIDAKHITTLMILSSISFINRTKTSYKLTAETASIIANLINKSMEKEMKLLQRYAKKRWNTYIASDGNSVKLPPQIYNMLCNSEFVPKSVPSS